jgi:hypothetical protein
MALMLIKVINRAVPKSVSIAASSFPAAIRLLDDPYWRQDFRCDGDGTITIKELHDGKAVIGIMGSTSGSGYIYPT